MSVCARPLFAARLSATASAAFFLAAFLLPDFRWHSVTSDGPDSRPQHGPVITFTLIDELRAWHDRPNGGFPALDFAARPGLAVALVAAVLATLRLRRVAVALSILSAVCWLIRWLMCANHGFGPGYYAFLLALMALSTASLVSRRPLGRRGRIARRIVAGVAAAIVLAALIVHRFVTGPQDTSKYPLAATSPYRLPFRGGLTRWCGQGNDGLYSHFGWQRYAYDFSMPVGSDIVAARGGVVRLVSVSFDGHGNWDSEISIRHDDGTWANYLHLIHGGSYVHRGQRVEQGDLLGASGDVGVSTCPHLHFAVYAQTADGHIVGLPVSFADVPGDGVPCELRRYTSGNRPAAESGS